MVRTFNRIEGKFSIVSSYMLRGSRNIFHEYIDTIYSFTIVIGLNILFAFNVIFTKLFVVYACTYNIWYSYNTKISLIFYIVLYIYVQYISIAFPFIYVCKYITLRILFLNRICLFSLIYTLHILWIIFVWCY